MTRLIYLGKDTMEMQLNILQSGARVLVVDDLLATGGMSFVLFYPSVDSRDIHFEGTLAAAQKLCVQLGYEVVETLVIIELKGLNGRDKLTQIGRVTALIQFSDADFDEISANPDRVHQPKEP